MFFRAIDRLEGGRGGFTAAAVWTMLFSVAHQGGLYEHGMNSDDGYDVVTLGGAAPGYVTFRSDVLGNIRSGQLGRRAGGRSACSVIGHEGVHLVQYFMGRTVGDRLNEREATATNATWRCR
jgi:hypothetical protein